MLTGGSTSSPISGPPSTVRDRSKQSETVVEGFWRAYTDATGLRIDPAATSSKAKSDENQSSSGEFQYSPGGALGLAEAATKLADHLQLQERMLKSDQAELAARAAVIATDASRTDLSQRVDRIFSDATLATGTDAVAVYLLDELTERLTTRFLFGLSPVNRLGSSRPLRGARTDLEAMVQGVVAVDDLRAGSMDLYRSPEPVASGICVCLGDIELPIGTMWLYGHQTNRFTDASTAAARLAGSHVCQMLAMAGNSQPLATTRLSIAVGADWDAADDIATDTRIESVVESVTDLPDENSPHIGEFDRVRIGAFSGNVAASPKPHRQPTIADWTRQVSDWQHQTLPLGERLAPDWSIDGMIESPLSIARSWHHWDVLPDGMMSMAMCQNDGTNESAIDITGVLDATIARAALHSHAAYRHTPGDAIMRVLDTLLQVRDDAIDEDGQPRLSLFYAHVDPETGHADIASVGHWSTLVVSKYGFRPVGMGTSHGVQSDAFMGRQAAEVRDTILQPGEVLLVTGRDWMGAKTDHATPQNQRAQSAQNRIGVAVQKSLRDSQRSPLTAIRRMLAESPLVGERTAMALQRDIQRRS